MSHARISERKGYVSMAIVVSLPMVIMSWLRGVQMRRISQSLLFPLLRWSPRPLSRVPRTRLYLRSHKRHQRKRKGPRMKSRTMVKTQLLCHLSKILNLMLQLRRKAALRPIPPTLSSASRKRRSSRSYSITWTLRTSRSYSQPDQRTSQRRKKSI